MLFCKSQFYFFFFFFFCPTVPPDEPRIFDTHGKEVISLAGPFRESQEFFLSCQVSGGHPPPKVTWWRNGIEIPGTSHQSVASGTVINNILMRSVPRSYYGSKLICKAQGSTLIEPIEKEVTIQLHCEYFSVYSCVVVFFSMKIHIVEAFNCL